MEPIGHLWVAGEFRGEVPVLEQFGQVIGKEAMEIAAEQYEKSASTFSDDDMISTCAELKLLPARDLTSSHVP